MEWTLICGGSSYPELADQPIPQSVYSLLTNLRKKKSLSIVHIGDPGSDNTRVYAQLYELFSEAVPVELRTLCLPFPPDIGQATLPDYVRVALRPGASDNDLERKILYVNYYDHLWLPVDNEEKTPEHDCGRNHYAADEANPESSNVGENRDPENTPLYMLIPPPEITSSTSVIIHQNPNIEAGLAKDLSTGLTLLKCPTLSGEAAFGSSPKKEPGILLMRRDEAGSVTAYEYLWLTENEWETLSTFLTHPSDAELDGAAAQQQQQRNTAKHEIVCRHWLRGICIKDWRCDFLHICDDTRMPYCRNQKRHGRCSDQVLGLCNLRHTTEEGEEEALSPNGTSGVIRTSPHDGNNGGGAQNSTTGSLDICMRYLFGYCPHGPMCHLRHVKLERRPSVPPLLPDWYLLLILNNYDLPPLEDDLRRKAVGQWLQFAIDSIPSKINSDDPLLPLLSLKPLQSLIPDSAQGSRQGLISNSIRCFVLKSGKIENILTSVQKGIWATGKSNMAKLNEAYQSCQYVLLLMSGNESGGFQGFGRMQSGFDPNLYPGVWGTFSNKLSPNFRIQWIKQTKLDFNILTTFTNPLNGNLPLKKSRDGQELTLELTEIICNLLSYFPQHDLLSGTPLQNLPRISHDTFFNMTPAQQIQEEVRLGLRQPPLKPRAAPVIPVQSQTPQACHSQTVAPSFPPNSPSNRQSAPRNAIQPHSDNVPPQPRSNMGPTSPNRTESRKRTRQGDSTRNNGPSNVNPYLMMAEELRRRR